MLRGNPRAAALAPSGSRGAGLPPFRSTGRDSDSGPGQGGTLYQDWGFLKRY